MRNRDCGWYYGLIDNDIYKAVESCKQYELELPKKAKWLETRDDNLVVLIFALIVVQKWR